MNGPQNDQEAPQGASRPTNATTDAIRQQMEAQWHGLMRMVTAQGGTREDILALALATMDAVSSMTMRAMWPTMEGTGTLDANEYPETEVTVAASFIMAHAHIHEGLRHLTPRGEENQAT